MVVGLGLGSEFGWLVRLLVMADKEEKKMVVGLGLG